MPSVLIPLCVHLKTCFDTCTSIVNVAPMSACDNRRLFPHRVFQDTARRGKSSTGWFFSFGLYVVFNDHDAPLDFMLTPG